MAATCIVCGIELLERKRSAEHVWPAVLGGRVTHRRIYCRDHNEHYGVLVAQLANRLHALNGMLGVVPDHDEDKRRTPLPVPVPGSDATVDLSDHGPREHARDGLDFESPEALLKARRAARGEAERPWPPAYILETARAIEFNLGDATSLAGATCVVQTLFAAAFPALARSAAMRTTIDYTDSVAQWLHAIDAARAAKGKPPGVFSVEVERDVAHHPGVAAAQQAVRGAVAAMAGRRLHAWSWEADGQADASHAQDEFGLWHRVVVGVDGTDGLMYGRVRFFGAFELVMILGRASGQASAQVTYHINPFAEVAKGSQVIKHVAHASARPALVGEQLAPVPQDVGRQQLSLALADFNRRREAYVAAHAAGQWLVRLKNATSAQEVEAICFTLWREHIQNVSIHLNAVVQTRLTTERAPLDAPMAERLRGLIARDNEAASGISPAYEEALQVACELLRAATANEWAAGRLDRETLPLLLSGHLGRFAVGQVVDWLVGAGQWTRPKEGIAR